MISAPPVNKGFVNSFAPLKNVSALAVLVETLKSRHPNLPGFGLFYGYSGYGKTHAAIYAQNRLDCIKIDMRPSWTIKTLLEALLIELEANDLSGTIPKMENRVIQYLSQRDAPLLIIDEADFLVSRKLIEHVRCIQEASGCSVILVGEELLLRKLEEADNTRTYNRMLKFVKAQPCDLEDARALATAWHRNLTFEDNMLQHLISLSSGKARLITTNLDHIAEEVKLSGLRTISLESYKGTYNTGEPYGRAPKHGRNA